MSSPTDMTPNAVVRAALHRPIHYTLITIRKSRVFDLVNEKELKRVIKKLKDKNRELVIINECYESGGHYGQLHVHLIVRSIKRLNYNRVKYVKGFYVNYRPLKTIGDVHRAQVYVGKEQFQSFSFAQSNIL